jgi:hypothetical protein
MACVRSQLLDELEEPAEEVEVRLKIKSDNFKPIADATIEAFRAWVASEAGPAWRFDSPNHEGVRVQVNLTSSICHVSAFARTFRRAGWFLKSSQRLFASQT